MMVRYVRRSSVLLAVIATCVVALAAPPVRGSGAGMLRPANNFSGDATISSDGRFVAFDSWASNLVAGDTNGSSDVFVYDRVRGTIDRVSVSSAGAEANNHSGYTGGGLAMYRPIAITPGGRFVAFVSDASNLVADDSNGQGIGGESCPDVFVRDRETGTTERVNVSSSGQQAKTEGFLNCSGQPSISADGQFVAFWSEASNLVAGDTNCPDPGDPRCGDVFVHDRKTGKTERVSVSTTGKQANSASTTPTISADGRFVYFSSAATNLAHGSAGKKGGLFVRDRLTRTTTRLPGPDGEATVAFSPGERFVAFTPRMQTHSRTSDLFLRDRRTAKTELVSVTTTGKQANGNSFSGAISANGRYVTFSSDASNLVSGDTNICAEYDPHGSGAIISHYPCFDVFLRDRKTRTTQRVSRGAAGGQANGDSGGVSMSADGRFVTFASRASNLVRGDTNKTSDIFLLDRQPGMTTLVTVGR